MLNYPNSPTGALADESFFEKAIAFGKKNEIVVVNDAAHSLLTYARNPLSFLKIKGAKDVGIEIHSMSKGFDMIGWRLGFFCGNERIVRALADVKDNCDSGQFIAVQKAGALALSRPAISQRIRHKYQRRLQKLVAAVSELGFRANMPGGSYFLYTRAAQGLADGRRFETAEAVSQFLIRERSICTVPWDDAGPFLRFSVTYHAPTEADEDNLMFSLKERLKDDHFVW